MRRRFLLVFILLMFLTSAAFGQQTPHIVLSNDDGITAPGLQALFTSLSKFAKVTVAAPSRNYSAVGHGLTTAEPIMVETWQKDGAQWHSVSALPATCVRLALTSLLDEKPDFLVSGINKGENVGVVTFSSATVACAREAAYNGIPSLAVSLQNGEVMDYDTAADYVAALIQEIRKKGMARGTYLNINYPALPKEHIKGVLVTKQDLRASDERFEKRLNPAGKVYFWSIYQPHQGGDQAGDVWALTNGYISITPLHFDQTHYPQIKGIKSWSTNKGKR